VKRRHSRARQQKVVDQVGSGGAGAGVGAEQALQSRPPLRILSVARGDRIELQDGSGDAGIAEDRFGQGGS
jgi:hypothetical protein